MDLTGRQQIYDEQIFKDGNYSKAELHSKEFNDCTFTRCTFNEALFQACIFSNCKFRDCGLSLIHVKDSLFAGTKFEDCKAVGVTWAEARWTQVGLLDPSIHFIGCAINYSTFIGVNLKKATLTKCIAHDVDFSEANLTGANCSRTDFAESRFSQTNLTDSDFTHATNYTINVQQNKIKGAKFSLPDAMALALWVRDYSGEVTAVGSNCPAALCAARIGSGRRYLGEQRMTSSIEVGKSARCPGEI